MPARKSVKLGGAPDTGASPPTDGGPWRCRSKPISGSRMSAWRLRRAAWGHAVCHPCRAFWCTAFRACRWPAKIDAQANRGRGPGLGADRDFGRRAPRVRGEAPSVTRVSRFIGHDLRRLAVVGANLRAGWRSASRGRASKWRWPRAATTWKSFSRWRRGPTAAHRHSARRRRAPRTGRQRRAHSPHRQWPGKLHGTARLAGYQGRAQAGEGRLCARGRPLRFSSARLQPRLPRRHRPAFAIDLSRRQRIRHDLWHCTGLRAAMCSWPA